MVESVGLRLMQSVLARAGTRRARRLVRAPAWWMAWMAITLMLTSSHASADEDGSGTPDLNPLCSRPDVIYAFFNNLTERGYDPFTRPSTLTGPAEQVEVQLQVLQLKKVEQMTNRVLLFAIYRRYWRDPRLSFSMTPAEGCTHIDVPTLMNLHRPYWPLIMKPTLWQPDFSWFNAEGTALDQSSGFFKIWPDGRVLLTSQVTLDVECPFKLKYFPYDAQHCAPKLGLYRENNASTTLHFRKGRAMEVALEVDNYEWALVNLTGERPNPHPNPNACDRRARLRRQGQTALAPPSSPPRGATWQASASSTSRRRAPSRASSSTSS